MILHPDELRRRIREAMDAAGIDAAELARRVNRKPDYFRDFLNGRKSSVKLGELAKLDEVLGLEAGSLGYYTKVATGAVSMRSDNSVSVRHSRSHYTAVSNRGMLIHSSTDLGRGRLSVSNDALDVVDRPWFMNEVVTSFGLLVNGNYMSPIFESGDIVLINPTLPPVKHKHVVLVSGDRTEAEYDASIMRLVDWNDEAWFASFSDGKALPLARAEWPEALRIVGKIEG